jgi:hypothetical protein
MPDRNPSTFSATPAEADRARRQGLGEGQREMDAGRDPNRDPPAADLERRSFGAGVERPADADLDDRNAAGLGDVRGDLGAGTPPNVDVHKLGQEDNPEQDWGEAAPEGAVYSSTNNRRGDPTEAQRGQGAKTRAANKDIVSRRK